MLKGVNTKKNNIVHNEEGAIVSIAPFPLGCYYDGLICFFNHL